MALDDMRIGLLSDCEGSVAPLEAALAAMRIRGSDVIVSEVDRQASLRMLAEVDAELVLCGHVPEPREFHDRLPDGRPLRVVRAGPRDEIRVGYAVLTRRNGSWTVEWGDAPI